MQRLGKHLSRMHPGLLVLTGLLVLASLLLSVITRALEPTQVYDLSWHTIDGGGHTWSAGGSYTLGGTAGQPDAGNLDGGTYTLSGGFWPGGSPAEVVYRVYLPLILRSYEP
jgi:hypothetical protein